MFKTYLKAAFRSLVKQRLFTTINIIGLSISMAVCLIIFVFVNNERGFDQFHQKADHIYRVCQWDYQTDEYSLNQNLLSARSFKGINKSNVTWGIGNYLKEIIPEVELATRFAFSPVFFKHKRQWLESVWSYADTTFFEIFSFPVLKGPSKGLLSQVTNVVVSEEAAEKYFGTTDIVGTEISIASILNNEGGYDNNFTDHSIYQVSAVVKVPNNSSIQFEFLIPINSLKGFSENANDHNLMFNSGNRFTTFVQMNASSDVNQVATKINESLLQVYASSIETLRTRRKLSNDNPVMSFDEFKRCSSRSFNPAGTA